MLTRWRPNARRALRIAVLATGLALIPAGVVSASAAPPASCMGHEASSVSSPGSSSEAPGGMSDFLPELRSFVSFFARLHEGSHEACDAAVE